MSVTRKLINALRLGDLCRIKHKGHQSHHYKGVCIRNRNSGIEGEQVLTEKRSSQQVLTKKLSSPVLFAIVCSLYSGDVSFDSSMFWRLLQQMVDEPRRRCALRDWLEVVGWEEVAGIKLELFRTRWFPVRLDGSGCAQIVLRGSSAARTW